MFPNVYGFSWTPLHLIFLGVFFSVAVVIAITVVIAAIRARHELDLGNAARIRWHSDFEELPSRDRVCRHEFTGEFRDRRCDNAFDCRHCTTHAKLIEARPPEPAPDECVSGLSFPADRMYHRGHTWVKEQPDGTLAIGPDQLAERMFGRLDQVEVPPPATRVTVNDVAWTVRKNGHEFRVLSPVDGEVVRAGGPDDNYYLTVRPTGGTFNSTHLLRGAEVRPWVVRELQRLQTLVSPDPSMPALADGGVLVDDAAAALPEVNWPAVWGEMLLEP